MIRIWELWLWICVVVAFRHGQLRDPCSVSVGTWGTQDSKSKCRLISLSVSAELKRHDGKESRLKADVCFVPRMPTCWLNNSLGLRIRLQIKFWLCLVLRQREKQNSVCLRKNLISLPMKDCQSHQFVCINTTVTGYYGIQLAPISVWLACLEHVRTHFALRVWTWRLPPQRMYKGIGNSTPWLILAGSGGVADILVTLMNRGCWDTDSVHELLLDTFPNAHHSTDISNWVKLVRPLRTAWRLPHTQICRSQGPNVARKMGHTRRDCEGS